MEGPGETTVTDTQILWKEGKVCSFGVWCLLVIAMPACPPIRILQHRSQQLQME